MEKLNLTTNGKFKNIYKMYKNYIKRNFGIQG